MEFIICDDKKMEVQYLPQNAEMDFDIGDLNDVEITIKKGILNYGMWIICPGTEYGALIEEIEGATTEKNETWRANSLRKFLQQYIIEPPQGQDYKIVSGDAHEIMRSIIGQAYEGLFEVPEEQSGITLSNYQFDRYTTALDGFTKMLKTKNARIEITIVQGAENEAFKVTLKAVPIVNKSEEIEYSEDCKISILFKESRRGINHLICLGKGDLKDRKVIHLYVQEDGSIGQTQFYTGLNERTAKYEYTSAGDDNELIESGKEYLTDLMNYKEMQMSITDTEDMQIGDIIAGRDYENGFYMQKPIVRKIVNISQNRMKIEYKVEGEE